MDTGGRHEGNQGGEEDGETGTKRRTKKQKAQLNTETKHLIQKIWVLGVKYNFLIQSLLNVDHVTK